MLLNNITLAYRNLKKQAAFTSINIAGLSLGLLCTLFIALWVLDEWNFDRFHANANRIYRFNADIKFGGADMSVASAPTSLGPTLLKDYPQVESACRLREKGALSVKHGDDVFNEHRVLFSDASVFDVFTFPLLEGDAKTALKEPNTVVISEKVAHKYFGGKSPIGESLTFDTDWTCKISAVMRDIPENSHIKADFFISMPSLEESKQENWLSYNFNTYFRFAEGYSPEKFNAEWPKIIQHYVAPMAEKVLGASWTDIEKSGAKVQFSMIALTDIHLHGGTRVGDLSPNGNADTVRIFGIIALIILLLATVNFMNLSTARSAQRAREVGLRKALGSQKWQLIGQFLAESLMMSLMAGLPAMLALQLLLPAFNQLAGKSISINLFQRPELLLGLFGFVLLTGLLAGLYPAFVLSSFKPIRVLKGSSVAGGGRAGKVFRNGLVTFQFAISMTLIVGAFISYRQLNFIQSKDLGFDRSQVLIINDALTLHEKSKTFKSDVLQISGVESGTVSGFLPTNGNHNDQVFFKDHNIGSDDGISLNNWWVDADYLKTMKIKLLEGRNFDPLAPADSNAILVNWSAAKILGMPSPLDKEIYGLRDVESKTLETFRIVGIVEDFHFQSLRDKIQPLIMRRGNYPANISFRLNSKDYPAVLSQINALWQKTAPGLPFNYEFMDEQFDQMYRSEQREATLALLFAGLAVFIACLGLFGLAAYTAEQRTKEIGIRKVLGASVLSVSNLLTQDFLKLVLIAIVLATPIAWYFMDKWLSDFAYRIDIQWWMFALAGLGALAIAFLTVGYQSVRAALANPVDSLKNN